MDAIYYIAGIITVLGLPAIIILTSIYLFKPQLLTKVKLLKKQQSRKQIALWGLLAVFVVFFGFGGIMSATEPESINRARIAEEAAQKSAAQEEQQKLIEQERQRKLEAAKPVVKTETKTKTVRYKTIAEPSATLAKGETKVSVKGSNGKQTTTYKVTYVSGEETSRKKVDTKVTKKPTNKIVLVGTYTAPKPRSVPSPAPRSSHSDGVVKMSRSSICHAPGTTYYSRTIHYTSYPSLSNCLSAGGRLPKR